jgi:hypothetical protein
MDPIYVAADPYPWPYDGDLRPANTALVIIDMQTDFCGIGGYVDRMGYDLSLTRAPIGPIAAVLAAMRHNGYLIFYTREGHRPDLADPRLTSAGARAGSAPASAILARAAAFWCAASRAGKSSPNSLLLTANQLSTSRAKEAFLLPTSNCCCVCAASPIWC